MTNQSPNPVEIFTEVAPKYEFLNSLLTAGQDKYWRNSLLSACSAALGKNPLAVLDLACGTGDVPRLIHEKWPAAMILATDPNQAMLQIAQKKSEVPSNHITWRLGSAEKIEAKDKSLDLITIAFGFRNIPAENRLKAMQEAFRVLQPGGVFAILELGLPKGRPARDIYSFLLRNIMPNFAGIFSPKAPYQYLAQSIQDFPPPDHIKALFHKTGFLPFAPRSLSAGMCWIFIGRKPFEQQNIREEIL